MQGQHTTGNVPFEMLLPGEGLPAIGTEDHHGCGVVDDGSSLLDVFFRLHPVATFEMAYTEQVWTGGMSGTPLENKKTCSSELP